MQPEARVVVAVLFYATVLRAARAFTGYHEDEKLAENVYSKLGMGTECVVFHDLRDDLQTNLFHNGCGDEARRVIRLAFHDAIGYSSSLGPASGGGADGSIITFASTELACIGNAGLEAAVADLRPFLYGHAVSPGDLVQFAAAVALTSCPGAPRLSFQAGREPPSVPAGEVNGYACGVPSLADDASALIARFEDAGLDEKDLVHLLAAHSVAHARQVDPNDGYASFDSTPAVFDSQFYLEVLLKGNSTPGNGTLGYGETGNALGREGEVRILSDYNVAHDGRTACAWQSMIGNQTGMMVGFAEAMAELAVVGQDVSKFVDCSEAVPEPAPLLAPPVRYPVGMGHENIQQTCNAPFPKLKAEGGIPSISKLERP